MALRPHEEGWAELIAGHAIGVLDPSDEGEVRKHLDAGCADCAAGLAGFEHAATRLALAPEPVAPSDLTRARILRAVKVAAGPQEAQRGYLGLAAAAMVAVSAGASIWAIKLRSEVTSLRADVDQLGRSLHQRETTSRIALAPGVRTVSLSGMDVAPTAVGQTYVNPAMGKAVFYAFKLPPPSLGRIYQLWFIAEGKPVSAGIFKVDEAGNAILEVPAMASVDRIEAWAVTLEPDGGMPQPTGEMYLKS